MEQDADVNYLEQGEPFLFDSNVKYDVGVVCVHGFTATPYEVRPIGEALAKVGFYAEGPAVYGHAIAPVEKGIEIFRHSKWTQWVDSIREVVDQVRRRFSRVFLFGQSMGGAISLYLASEGGIDAVAVTGAAIRIPRVVEVLSPLIGLLDVVLKTKEDPEEETFFNPSYKINPSKAGYQLNKLAKETRKRLSLIECPVLVCHSHADDTVPPQKVPKLIQECVKGPVTVRWFDQSGHTMPLDVQGPEIVETVTDFFLARVK